MRPRRSVLALSVAVLALAGCGGSSSPSTQPTPTPAPASPSEAPTSAPPSTPTSALRSVNAYFLRGEKVVSVHRTVPVTSGAVAAAAMRALLSGPTASEKAAGITTTIPTGTVLHGVTISGGTADVDLSAAYESGGGSLSMSARLMQVVYTLTQFPTVQRVTWRLDGKPVTVFGGEGIVLDQPATRAQYESFLPPIFIDSPARGETVRSPVTVRGVANVFEGQFLVEVTDKAGKVLAREPAMASMGTYTAFTKVLRFSTTTPGPGRVTGFDYSAKDGARIDDYVVPVTLR